MSEGPAGSAPGSPGSDPSDPRGSAARPLAAASFAAGGAADELSAGPELAASVERVWRDGLAPLSDDELIGVLRAARRLASRAAAMEWSAVAELVARRQAAGSALGDPRPGEVADAEVAAALTLTRCAAAHLQDLALGATRLPGVMKALVAGRIDAPKASVIAGETAGLGDVAAGAVAAVVIRDAPGQTTGQLRAVCRQMVLFVDPSAARRRKEAALQQTRVELWPEPGGTSALAGRDLPTAAALAADRYLAAAARWLKAQGVEGTVGQLRAQAFLALLTGRPLHSLLPASSPAEPYDSPGPDSPGRVSPGPNPAAATEPASSTADAAGAADEPSPGRTIPGPAPVSSSAVPGHPPVAADGPVLTGSVNLTLPLMTWLGWAQSPGQVPGFGPVDAADSRSVGEMLARHPGTRWCLTLTGPAGEAVAHACARHGPAQPPPDPLLPPGAPGTPHDRSLPGSPAPPSPPGRPGAPLPGRPGARPPGRGDTGPPGASAITRWLAALRFEPLGSKPCAHILACPGYRPSRQLQHLTRVRNPVCTHPGCRNPASRCDLDHTRPYHRGGATCLCNLGPRCRYHHQVKQAPGWRLTQPRPGVFTITTPAGRSYTTTPPAYPV